MRKRCLKLCLKSRCYVISVFLVSRGAKIKREKRFRIFVRRSHTHGVKFSFRRDIFQNPWLCETIWYTQNAQQNKKCCWARHVCKMQFFEMAFKLPATVVRRSDWRLPWPCVLSQNKTSRSCYTHTVRHVMRLFIWQAKAIKVTNYCDWLTVSSTLHKCAADKGEGLKVVAKMGWGEVILVKHNILLQTHVLAQEELFRRQILLAWC